MAKFTSPLVLRRLKRYQRLARKVPVKIRGSGGQEFVLMSKSHYEWLRLAIGRAHRTERAPQFLIDAVSRAQMNSVHQALDALLDP